MARIRSCLTAGALPSYQMAVRLSAGHHPSGKPAFTGLGPGTSRSCDAWKKVLRREFSSCTGTVPNGQPGNTAATGKHTLTVQAAAGGKTAAGTVTCLSR